MYLHVWTSLKNRTEDVATGLVSLVPGAFFRKNLPIQLPTVCNKSFKENLLLISTLALDFVSISIYTSFSPEKMY